MTKPESSNGTQIAPSNLTPKQETFCQGVASGMNNSEAYRHAYDVGNMKPATVANNAYMLVNDSDIAASIVELRRAVQEQIAWDFARGMTEVETNITGARAEKQYAAANRGTEQALKLSGLLSDRPQDPGSVPITKVTVVLNHGNRDDGEQTEAIETSYRVLPDADGPECNK